MNTKKTIDATIKQLSDRWQLSNIRPFVKMPPSNNYAAIAHSEKYKTDVVLKVLMANTNEPQALALFKGNGCVQLLDYDSHLNGLLLEYITPGTSLKSFFPANDAQAIAITADLIKKLQKNNPLSQAKNFKTIKQWLALLDKFQGKKIPEHLLKRARQLSEKLLRSNPKMYLLHGDLHHENILQKDRDWVAIDPQGVIGPLEYEVGRFIMNPIPDLLQQQNAKEIIKTRIDTFSEIFGFEEQNLIDWTFVHAVLSACWGEEDGGEMDHFVQCAETMKDL